MSVHAHEELEPRQETERIEPSPHQQGPALDQESSPPRPLVGGLAFPKEKTSADLLSDMVKPQVFEGPQVEVQKGIITALEAAIEQLKPGAKNANAALRKKVDDQNQQARDAIEVKKKSLATEKSRFSFSPWRQSDKQLADTESSIQDEERRESRAYSKKIKAIPTGDYDQDVFYLGSIVLDRIPASAKEDAQMVGAATLEQTDYSLKNTENGTALPKQAGKERDIVANTLQTMIKAGQIEYLRKSGIVGDEWQVVVEVHYYRSRNKNQANLHKDTLGQTLFVNLNYTNEDEAPGPEYVVNPPLIPEHESVAATKLPSAFQADLAQTRERHDPASTIENSTIPPHGVVSFVDESIHHATPLVGHRRVRPDGVRKFLAADPEVSKDAELVKKVESLCVEKQASGPETESMTRPELRAATLTDEQIDRLLSEYGPNEWNTVSIPGGAHASGQSKREPIAEPKAATTDPAKPKTRLKRAMSYEKLESFPKDDPVAPRRFFRTWIRAVKKTDVDESRQALASMPQG